MKPAWGIPLAAGLLAAQGCGGRAPATVSGPDVVSILDAETIVLERPADGRALYALDDTFYLAEGRPDFTISRWTIGGRELPRPLPPGRAPGNLVKAADSFLEGRDGLVGVLDWRSYRVSFLDAPTGRFVRSFVVSPLGIAAMGGAGDPAHGRIYLFAGAQNPEVRTVDLDGREDRPGLDLFDDTYTTPYARFRAAVDPAGNLYYTPRASYIVARVTPDGKSKVFARRDRPPYVSPLPIPEDLSGSRDEKAWAVWEKTRSWIKQVVWSDSRLLVCYSVPGDLDTFALDVYDADGRLSRSDVSIPGALLGCDRSGRCWFLAPDHRRIVRGRVA